MTDSNSNLIFLVLIIGLLVFLIFSKDKKEGFQNNNTNSLEEVEGLLLKNIKENLRKKYPDSSEEIINDLATKELTIKSYGMNPQTHSMDLSKFVRKSELEGAQKCLVENADNKDEYIHKNQVPYQPKVDLDKYVLKSSIPPQKECPPQKEIDYSKYVLKSSIPPVQKCPPCICPKVKVSAGLCQKCPPPPKCPAPEACPPPPTCPEPKPCPTQKQEVLHKIKYIKVPTLIQPDNPNSNSNSVSSGLNPRTNPNFNRNVRQETVRNMYLKRNNNLENNSIKQKNIPVGMQNMPEDNEIVQEETDDLNNIPNYHLNQINLRNHVNKLKQNNQINQNNQNNQINQNNQPNQPQRMFELNSIYTNAMLPVRGNPASAGF